MDARVGNQRSVNYNILLAKTHNTRALFGGINHNSQSGGSAYFNSIYAYVMMISDPTMSFLNFRSTDQLEDESLVQVGVAREG